MPTNTFSALSSRFDIGFSTCLITFAETAPPKTMKIWWKIPKLLTKSTSKNQERYNFGSNSNRNGICLLRHFKFATVCHKLVIPHQMYRANCDVAKGTCEFLQKRMFGWNFLRRLDDLSRVQRILTAGAQTWDKFEFCLQKLRQNHVYHGPKVVSRGNISTEIRLSHFQLVWTSDL